MNALVVVAHPSEASLCQRLADVAVTTLQTRHRVIVTRLWPATAAGAPDELVGRDLLVLVYPTWWGGPPAPLKQWLDDHLDHDDRAFRAIRRLVVVTTHGSPHWVNRLQGEPGRAMLMRGLRSRCNPLARRSWLALYGVDRDDPVRTNRFANHVRTKLEGV